jgi:hypothetical protein
MMSDTTPVILRSGKKTGLILSYMKKPAVAAITIPIVDTLALLAGFGFISRDTLSLVVLLEGGIGLISGVGIALSSTPSISKIGQATIGTAAWSKEAERNAERVGLKWIVTASLLVLVGFALSIV